MSEGIRSGVNWMRLKLIESSLARLEIMSVFASPGTPSRMQWPRQKMPSSSSSSTGSWPTTTCESDSIMRRWALATPSASAATEAGSRAATGSATVADMEVTPGMTAARVATDPG